MKIVRFRLTRERIALRTPFITALRRVEAVEFLLLELMTDTGLCAQGSAPATRAVTGETLQSIESALRTQILPSLLQRPFELPELLTALHAGCPGNSSARAAADMALHALAAQQAGMPLYRLLGGDAPLSLRTAVTVSLDTPERMRRQASDAFGRGETILKIKVGSPDGKDVQRVRAIREALPDAPLLVDANQAWNLDETLRFLDAAAPLGIELVEQPLPAADLEGLRDVTRRSPVPILADEAVFTVEDARRVIESGAADLINIKLMKCGGIAGAVEIIDLCRRHGMRCMLGSMLEGPVSITAALQLATANADAFAWLDLDSPLLYARPPDTLPFSVDANRYRLCE